MVKYADNAYHALKIVFGLAEPEFRIRPLDDATDDRRR